jgi:uncharacterized protein (TIGR02996 family)
MTDDDLLAQIAAAPDDDAPRAVYADLLLQRGDPRGEFIQLQLEHADSDREHELLRTHEAAWNDAAGVRGAGASYQRGFIYSLWGSPATIVASRDALRTQPIVRLSLEPDGEFAALATLPELARIRTLTLRAQRLSPSEFAPLPSRDLAALAAVPFVGLRSLEIGGWAIDDAGGVALADARWLPALEQVTMWKCQLGRDGYDALMRHFASLHALVVDYASDAASCVAAVARYALPRLASLSLKQCRLGTDNACAFATSPHVEGLRELFLAGNEIGPAAGAAFGDSRALAALELLSLYDNQLGEEGIAALARGGGLPALRRLVISGNGVPESREQLAARFAHRPGLAVS